MKEDSLICNFFISNKFEAINFTYGLDSFIHFELLGISKEEYTSVGNLFFKLFNNYDIIIKILEDSKKYLNDPMYDLLDYIKSNLSNIDRLLSQIITRELENYHSEEFNDISKTQSDLKNIQNSIEEYTKILYDSSLYNQYYEDLINDTKETIKGLKNKNDINYQTEFLNYLYSEKKDTKKGKKFISSTIQDLKEDEKQAIKDLRTLNELPSLMDKYITKLINNISNYKYFFEIYYGILEESELKNKNISYFQSIFGLDFEIPRHIVYASYEEYETFYPLKNLMISLYDEAKNKNEKIIDNTFYNKILNKTNSLNNNGEITYIKSYEIYNLKDILNIYFNFFIQEKINIRKCINCGRYFFPSSRSDEKYCNSISPQNQKKTCKEYGAKIKYREAIKSRPLKEEHNRTMQFYRMRITRAKTDKEKNFLNKKFDKYKENYNKKKIQYKNKKLKEQDFIDWIIQQKHL